jgi:hypothetical protein
VHVKGCGRFSVCDGLLDLRGVVRASWEARWWEMKESFVKVVGSSASATEGLMWKLSDSCHQHALHQVDTYV